MAVHTAKRRSLELLFHVQSLNFEQLIAILVDLVQILTTLIRRRNHDFVAAFDFLNFEVLIRRLDLWCCRLVGRGVAFFLAFV